MKKAQRLKTIHPNSGAFFVLLIVLFALQLTAHFLPEIMLSRFDHEVISLDWKYCIHGRDDSPESCNWKNIDLPAKIPLGKVDPKKSVLSFKAKTDTQGICNGKGQVCSLFVGTVSDPAEVKLNGKLAQVFSGGQYQPRYSQTFPMNVLLPPSEIKGKGDEIQVDLYPTSKSVHGLIRGPVSILPSHVGDVIHRAMIVEIILLPLFCGAVLLMLGLIGFAAIPHGGQKVRKELFYFAGYATVMGIYMVSLSRLPRELIPVQLAMSVHFGIRFFTEFFHLNAIRHLFGLKSRLIKYLARYQFLMGATLLLATLPQFFGEIAFLGEVADTVRFVYRKTLYLFLASPILVFIAIYRSRSSKEAWMNQMVWVYGAVFLMIISDFLALNGLVEDIYFVRFYPLVIGISLGYAIWHRANQERIQGKIQQRLGALARQAAHDIKSPLATLKMACKNSEIPSEEDRLVMTRAISRVSDIVNVLNTAKDFDLSRATVETDDFSEADSIGSSHLVNVVENLLSEKRVQHQIKAELSLVFEPQDSLYSLFLQAPQSELKRVLSNLIDNAIAAVEGRGSVQVVVDASSGSRAEITVKDSGPGIAENDLPQIFNEGFTTKRTGQGLGLYYVKERVEEWGGAVSVESDESGTEIKFTCPTADPPKWFVEDLDVNQSTQIVILDDDDTVFKLWEKRFRGLDFINPPLQLKSGEQLIRWHEVYSKDFNNVLYLIDYEFWGQNLTGIDIIQKLGIKDRAILVTAHSEASGISVACSALGLRMIPKECVEVVPIADDSFNYSRVTTLNKSFVAYGEKTDG